jgi:chloramphenicol-sensitive protein RarD
MRKGVAFSVGAYVMWGFLPVFWKTLQHVPALEILAHRVVWGCAVALLLVAARGRWRWLAEVAASKRTLLLFAASAILLTANWFVYIWAVNSGHVVETSLGYFINPLVNVLLGVLFLRERLRVGQAIAVAIACAGVLYLTVQHGSPPWIALGLASTFGLYGLLRKTATLGSLEGLTLETILLLVPALGFLLYRESAGGAFIHAGLATTVLLVLAGVATSAPLLLFAAGARRVTLTTLGILQYIAPTLQFALGVLVYGEPLTTQRLVGFCVIWLALLVYTAESAMRRTAAPVPAAGEA